MNRKIDEVGRIVIPKEIRKKLNIKENTKLKIDVEENKVIISKDNDVDYVQALNEIKKKINSIDLYEKDYWLDSEECDNILQIIDKALGDEK